MARGSFFVAALTAAGCAAWLAWHASPAPVVHAQGTPDVDSDGDGLPDGLEAVLNTYPDRFDTDGDGYCDSEEVARHSKPRKPNSTPSALAISVGMNAFLEGGDVHAVTAVYLPDGMLRGKRIEFGALVGNQLIALPFSSLRGGAPVRLIPSRDGVGVVVVLDPVFSEQSILAKNGSSMYARVLDHGVCVAADAVNLAVVNGEIYQQVVLGYQNSETSPTMNVGLGVGGVYRPISSGNGNPSNSYSTGEICAQSTVVVGVVGAVVTSEVTGAECVSGWDAHCSAGCSATVGTTIKTIDPGALIGG